MNTEYQETHAISRALANRMRSGSAVNNLLAQHNSQTHYIDALDRFHKDFASYQKHRREQQKLKRQRQLQQKRLAQLERENSRWGKFQQNYKHQAQKVQKNLKDLQMGVKRTAHSNGLAYNPINLQYEKNPEGEKLRTKDEDHKIRGLVRAHNMEFRGNSKFNPLTGTDRNTVDSVVPENLHQRYEKKLYQHYDSLRLKIPPQSEQGSRIRIRSPYI